MRFTVATNPGAPPGPIEQIASGGELSRFLLALKVCWRARSSVPTLIFDEIDRGVGGATADAVGERLALLGQEPQVLVVTHCPQVAARGRTTGRSARPGQGRDRDPGREPGRGRRREEIARMLSGASVTAEARAAATSLLAAGAL